MAIKTVFLTSGSSWVPDITGNVEVHIIGAGGKGGTGNANSIPKIGGGGGAYAYKASVAVTSGVGVPYVVAAGGSEADTWFASTATVLAKAGTNGPTHTDGTSAVPGVAGGQASGCVGDLAYSGGDSGGSVTGTSLGSTGGGGAAGPSGAGKNSGSITATGGGGTGGGGSNGGLSTAGADHGGTTTGGPGGHGSGGSGGGAGAISGSAIGTAGTLGGGGGGGGRDATAPSAPGGQQDLWTETIGGAVAGPGGGGGGAGRGNTGSEGGAGGGYGGGGGGTRFLVAGIGGLGGAGAPGIIVLVYDDAAGGGDTTAPTITSSATIEIETDESVNHTLTADEAVTWSIDGGADADYFYIDGDVLMSAPLDPLSDADANGVCEVTVRATDAASNFTTQNITVTVGGGEEPPPSGSGRVAFSTEALTEVSTTSTTIWSDVSTLTETLTEGDWLVLSTRRYAHSSSSGSVDLRLLEDDVQITSTTLRVRAARASFYPSTPFMHRVQSTGGSKTIKTQLKASTAGTAYSDDGRIILLKLGAGDLWGESLARQTTTLTTPQNAVSITATVEAGDYVAIGFGVTDNSATQAPAYVRLIGDGSAGPETGSISTVTSAVGSFLLVRRFTVAAGERTFGLQFRAHSSTTAGIRDARLCVLKAADFDNLYYQHSDADSFGTETEATDVVTMSETVTATPHLMVMSAATSAAAVNINTITKIRAGGVDLQESVNRSYNGDVNRSAANPYVNLATPEPGLRNYRLSRRSDQSVTAHRVKAGAAIAVFDLGVAGGGEPEPPPAGQLAYYFII